MKSQGMNRGKAKPHERGNVLVIATLVVVVMALMAIPFLFKLSGQQRSAERAARALAAFNLAEAGVDKAAWEINMDWTDPYDPALDPERISWSLDRTNGAIDDIHSSDDQVIGDVSFSLSPDPDPSGTMPSTRSLDSTGMVGFIADNTVDRTVRVTLEKHFGSIWDFGFFIDQKFHINNTQLTVDSYDSREANYDPRNPGDLGFFAINNDEPGSFMVDQGGGGTINVTGAIAGGGNALVEGDGEPVTEEEANLIIDLPKTAEPDVSQVPMTVPFVLPPVDLFTLHPKETWLSPNDISEWFIINEEYNNGILVPPQANVNASYQKDPFNLNGTGTMNAESGNGVYQHFEIADAGTLYIDGDVTIFVTGYGDQGAAPGHFIMGRDSSIRINPGGSLTLILGIASFYMGHQSTINVPLVDNDANLPGQDQPGYPADCLILGMEAFGPNPYRTEDLSVKEGQDIIRDPTTSPLGTVVFEQQVDISAAIYTPNAQVFDIQGMNHADIYGAWIAESMEYKVAAAFHYDEALGDIMTITGGAPKWRIINWHEKVGN